MKFVRGDDAESWISIFPPELVPNHSDIKRIRRFGDAFGREDDSGGCEKKHYHNQNWNHGPGQLNLIATVNLGRFARRVFGPMAEAEQRIK